MKNTTTTPKTGAKTGAKTTPKTGAKTGAVTFTANALKRTRTATATDGGRYNAKTRRLTLPSNWTGKRADVLTADGLLAVRPNADGAYAVHPTQRFLTLPSGAVTATANVTLKRADVPKTWDVPVDTLAWRLP